jgi:hypothetical protein
MLATSKTPCSRRSSEMPDERMDMRAFRILQAAMMVQILLGLWRFLAPYTGLPVNALLWMIHPLLGITIAAAALILFRPLENSVAHPQWTAARYVALAPLALGLSMRYGLLTGWPAVLTHMALGLTALGLIDSAIKKEAHRRSGMTTDSQAPSDTPQTV